MRAELATIALTSALTIGAVTVGATAYAAIGGAQAPYARAAAVVNADGGVVRSKDVTAVRKIGTGQYCIQLHSDIDATKAVPVATKRSRLRRTLPRDRSLTLHACRGGCGREPAVSNHNRAVRSDPPRHPSTTLHSGAVSPQSSESALVKGLSNSGPRATRASTWTSAVALTQSVAVSSVIDTVPNRVAWQEGKFPMPALPSPRSSLVPRHPRRAALAGLVLVPLLAGAVPAADAQAPVRIQPPQVVLGPVSADGGYSMATCPGDTKVMGGGYVAHSWHRANGGDMYDAVISSAPTNDGNGWVARLLKGKVQARALCVPSSEAPQVVRGPVSEDGNASEAICPEGTQVVNGGYLANSFHYARGGTLYDMVIASAPMADGKGWTAQQFKGKTEARALCAETDQN